MSVLNTDIFLSPMSQKPSVLCFLLETDTI